MARPETIVQAMPLHRGTTVYAAMTMAGLVGVSLLALSAAASSHRAATDAARADLAALEDASELQGLLYQKGFVAEYLLTDDPRWLGELDRLRPGFEQWLAGLTRDASDDATARATSDLVAEY